MFCEALAAAQRQRRAGQPACTCSSEKHVLALTQVLNQTKATVVQRKSRSSNDRKCWGEKGTVAECETPGRAGGKEGILSMPGWQGRKKSWVPLSRTEWRREMFITRMLVYCLSVLNTHSFKTKLKWSRDSLKIKKDPYLVLITLRCQKAG